MKKHNYKTAQRSIILEYLKHNGHHPDITDLYKNVSIKLSASSASSVYNTMDFPKQDGLVYELPLRNVEGMIFDTNLISQNHLICTICGKIVDIEDDVDHSLLLDEIPKDGFAIRKISIEFYGVCPDCKNMDSKSN
jgi:Fur family peroxide stress response transcriptional regulator